MADAFISCWDEKNRSNLIRPETLINEHIDEYWTPVYKLKMTTNQKITSTYKKELAKLESRNLYSFERII